MRNRYKAPDHLWPDAGLLPDDTLVQIATLVIMETKFNCVSSRFQRVIGMKFPPQVNKLLSHESDIRHFTLDCWNLGTIIMASASQVPNR